MNAPLRSLVLATVATIASIGVAAVAAPASASALAPATTATSAAPGTVSADLSVGNVVISGTKASNVTCTLKGTTYTVRTSRVTVQGYQVTGNVVIRNFTGPGTYTAGVSLSVKGPKASVAGLVKGVQVTVDDAGGTWSFSKTATGNTYPKLQGKTISGSLSYGCNA